MRSEPLPWRALRLNGRSRRPTRSWARSTLPDASAEGPGVAYTLRGRLESRLAVVLAPLLAACVVALALKAWWPVELAGLMLGVGLAFDLTLYHRLFPYQPGWAALPLGLLELAVVMGLGRLLNVGATLGAALAFYGGRGCSPRSSVTPVSRSCAFPTERTGRARQGRRGRRRDRARRPGLRGRDRMGHATAVVHLAAGVHKGPLVLDHSQKLVGEPGAVVRGGIVVTADDVTVRDVTVIEVISASRSTPPSASCSTGSRSATRRSTGSTSGVVRSRSAIARSRCSETSAGRESTSPSPPTWRPASSRTVS